MSRFSKNNFKMKYTKEEVKKWKNKHGRIYELKSKDGASCIIRKPDRKVLSHASAVSNEDPIKFNESVLNDCWIVGDDEMKTDDAKFLGISEQLAKIIEKAEIDLKEL